MPNTIIVSPESEETAKDDADLAQTVATSRDRGAPEERTRSQAKRSGRLRGRQRGRRGRRSGVHSSAVLDRLPGESVAPAENPLLQATLSLGSGDGEEGDVQSLKRKLQDMDKEKNEIKEKFDRLSPDLIQKEMCFMTLNHHVECLRESSDKLERENENLRVTKQETMVFSINHKRMNRTEKET